MIKKVIVAAILTIFFIFGVDLYAKTVRYRELHELYSYADVIVYGDILSGEVSFHEDTSCGAKYSIKVSDIFKGENIPSVINFGRYFGLKIGSSYLVFMKWSDGTANRENSFLNTAPKELITCDGLIPGYLYFGDGLFENEGGFFHNMPYSNGNRGEAKIDEVFTKLKELKEKK